MSGVRCSVARVVAAQGPVQGLWAPLGLVRGFTPSKPLRPRPGAAPSRARRSASLAGAPAPSKPVLVKLNSSRLPGRGCARSARRGLAGGSYSLIHEGIEKKPRRCWLSGGVDDET